MKGLRWGRVKTTVVIIEVPDETPYCDCAHPAMGFTKRYDGVWVRPCCHRPSKDYYDRHGDEPIILSPARIEEVKARNKRETAVIKDRLSSGN